MRLKDKVVLITASTRGIGLPEEIAEAVCYFAGDASGCTTGQLLTVSGGFGLATPVYGAPANKANRR